MKDEALRLALEYVELVPDDRYNAEHIDQDALITAIKAALLSRSDGEAKDEPDKYAMDIECTKCGAKQSGVLTVHTTPPQRTWVGLTDEEWVNALGKVREQLNGDVFGGFYRAIEAKLKEKNT